ncbi:MAG: HesA/MoeB/ThiF family protein, partial [Pseudomonadota bacterium]|nr:HesA/MoeB/ThiF family protein [Pseudomonadota bacterium]
MTLTPTQLDRYKRHILLKEIGGAGQQALLRARVLIVGMGGLGNPLAQYLAAAGVGMLGLVDDDCVDLSNLQRQTLFGTQDIGARKVDVAAARLTALNPDVEIVCHPMRVTAENIDALIGQYDVIADGCDNFATRYIVNDACFRARKTLV